ncbi:MAG TPA: pyridoxamine 5'-phosphate oxidase family protein [Candidatus Limnocylindrales bacterium]
MLPDRVREFLTEKPRFAAVATTNADRTPHQSFIWFGLDPDDRVRINSRPPRRWWANIQRTGRVAFAIADTDDQYRWVGLSGVVDEVVRGEDARDDIIAFAHRYHDGHPEPTEIAMYRTQERYTFLIRIVAVHDHLE